MITSSIPEYKNIQDIVNYINIEYKESSLKEEIAAVYAVNEGIDYITEYIEHIKDIINENIVALIEEGAEFDHGKSFLLALEKLKNILNLD